MNEEEEIEFRKNWEKEGWRTMSMHDGALEACFLLHNAGYELVCVTAMQERFTEHRLENFRTHGFPIDRIIGTGFHHDNFSKNPKKTVIEQLHPVVFVDDLRRNFNDIQDVHTKMIFIDHQYIDDPNQHDNIYYDAKYPSLLHFAQDFLKSDQHGEHIDWPQRPSHLNPLK